LARKLGLDPRSLLDDVPRFVWSEAKFKNLSAETAEERAAMMSFGTSIGRSLLFGTPKHSSIVGTAAMDIRTNILAQQPFVRLQDLLGLAWGVGIPVIHLRVFPLTTKHMCAMSIACKGRFAILLGKDSNYPAPIAYYLAHEIAHIALEHLQDGQGVIDIEDPLAAANAGDEEEMAADRYALELLTGSPQPIIKTSASKYSAAQLAKSVTQAAAEVRTEPGTLALCFGHSTGDWEKAYGAMKVIYPKPQPAWEVVNAVAGKQLDWSAIPEDLGFFLQAAMGKTYDDHGGDR